MLFIILILAVVLLVLSPYIVIVLKRRKMLKRITYMARRSGFRVRMLHRFSALSLNFSSKYDVLFENKEHAFAVKLWCATRKNSTMLVLGNGKVAQSMTVPSELFDEKGRTLVYGAKRMPKTKINFKLAKNKPLDRFLLCYPPNSKIVLCSKEGRKTLYSGDILFDKIICFPSDLETLFSGFRQNTENKA